MQPNHAQYASENRRFLLLIFLSLACNIHPESQLPSSVSLEFLVPNKNYLRRQKHHEVWCCRLRGGGLIADTESDHKLLLLDRITTMSVGQLKVDVSYRPSHIHSNHLPDPLFSHVQAELRRRGLPLGGRRYLFCIDTRSHHPFDSLEPTSPFPLHSITMTFLDSRTGQTCSSDWDRQ